MYQKTIKETIKVATDTLDLKELSIFLEIDHEKQTYKILNSKSGKEFVFFGDERLNNNQFAVTELIQRAIQIAYDKLSNN